MTLRAPPSLPHRLRPAFEDPSLKAAITEAQATLNMAPVPWRVVDAGGSSSFGLQTLNLPFETVPVPLSEGQVALGRERMKQAHAMVCATLTLLDERIAHMERSGPRRMLAIIAIVLVVVAVTLLLLGFFQVTTLPLTGKGGAATLLLGSGVAILTRLHLKDREARTLPLRMRLRLDVCTAHIDYDQQLKCFHSAIEEIDKIFSSIVASPPST